MSKYIAKHVAEMTGYTPGEQPSVSNIIKLNTNENSYPPSSLIAERLAQFDLSRLRLYPDPVCKKLRERIAEIHKCGSNNVFVGNGSDEILALVTRAFVENEGSIGWFVPSYSLYPVLATIRDVEHRPVVLTNDFKWQMPTDYKASLFMITNPNAPTSLLFERQQVAQFCKKFDGVVLIDEAYVDFADTNCMELAIAPHNSNTLVMRTLSKSYSLAGLRLGYVVGPEDLIEALYKIKDSYNIDMLTQLVALAALEDREYMLANVERIKKTRQRLSEALTDLHFKVISSQTNFVFARPSNGDASGLFNYLHARNIFVRYFPGTMTGEYVRVTIGTDKEVDALLAAIKNWQR